MTGWVAIAAYRCRIDGVPTDAVDFQVRYFDLPAPSDVEAVLRNEPPCEYENHRDETVSWPLARILVIQDLMIAASGDEIAGFRAGVETLSALAGEMRPNRFPDPTPAVAADDAGLHDGPGEVMRITRVAGAGLLLIAGIACSLPPPAPATSAPPSRPDERTRERVRQPGITVPGSQVGLPDRARAGSIIEGRAPAGSRVEAAGQTLEVGEDMRFRLRIPAGAHGAVPVRIVRPDRTVLVLRVMVDER
ncbi:hypothetical protein [Luteimonas suaedae]|uniref:hypothetical protein n=1 Tax=Luteimonas suaedae TaxID=2605430 RepID=UPI0011EC872D|nr:hypothetical protein [Luteimonas suaedae]